MNRFDAIYDIRLALAAETKAVMEYIAEDWKPGHIMSADAGLFDYEYNTSDDGRLNIMMAVRKDDGRIDGMLGFIPASKGIRAPDLWGSIWKVRSGSMMFLGNEMMKRLLETVPHGHYAAVGINISTTGRLVGRTMGHYVGRMRHWYMLNDEMPYGIAVVNHKKEAVRPDGDIPVLAAADIGDVDRCFDYAVLEKRVPYKDRWYIKRRYFDYPINKYTVYLLGGDKADALLVMREVSANGSKAVRIVDYIGNAGKIRHIGNFVRKLLTDKKYEYADFYEHGFADSDLISAGFSERTERDENIIPNYFAPFERRNVEIYFHSPDSGYIVCKADGDQDRPNRCADPAAASPD